VALGAGTLVTFGWKRLLADLVTIGE